MTQTKPAHPPQNRATGMRSWRAFIPSQMDQAQTDGLTLEHLIDLQRLSHHHDGART